MPEFVIGDVTTLDFVIGAFVLEGLVTTFGVIVEVVAGSCVIVDSVPEDFIGEFFLTTGFFLNELIVIELDFSFGSVIFCVTFALVSLDVVFPT